MKVVTMRGAEIDMDAVLAQHGDQIAVGTRGRLRMNARGDLVAPGGVVAKTSAEMTREYNRATTRAVRTASLRAIADEVLPTPDEAVAAILADSPATAAPATPAAVASPPKRAPRKIVD